jgi:hypothetical protein
MRSVLHIKKEEAERARRAKGSELEKKRTGSSVTGVVPDRRSVRVSDAALVYRLDGMGVVARPDDALLWAARGGTEWSS